MVGGGFEHARLNAIQYHVRNKIANKSKYVTSTLPAAGGIWSASDVFCLRTCGVIAVSPAGRPGYEQAVAQKGSSQF